MLFGIRRRLELVSREELGHILFVATGVDFAFLFLIEVSALISLFRNHFYYYRCEVRIE